MRLVAVIQRAIISVAWRIREVDAVVVVGIEVDEPSVNVGIETDASHCERCATLAHIHHVSLVLVNLSTLREHVYGVYIVDVLRLAHSAQSLQVEP